MPPTQAQLQPAEALLCRPLEQYTHTYDERDVALYALALGCGADDLRLVYEAADGFAPLPTFAVIPAHPLSMFVPMEQHLPGFDRAKALHGEQYVELLAPLPPAAELVTRGQVLDVRDKGRGAVVVLRTVTSDAATGQQLVVNEFTTFALGTGRFDSVRSPLPRSPAATADNTPPDRPPDIECRVTTRPDQAALYRLCGDLNPLHIDPEVSTRAGFSRPILHGLATLGISAREVLRTCGRGGGDPASVASIKCRFAKPVFPGETLIVRMWLPSEPGGSTVVWQTEVADRPGTVAISGAAVRFQPGQLQQQQQKQQQQQQGPASGGAKLPSPRL